MQELAIRGLEHGDTKGQIYAHQPELGGARCERSNDVADQANSTIGVKRRYAGENEGQPANLETGEASMVPKEEHAGGEGDCPCDSKAHVDPSQRVEHCLRHCGERYLSKD